MPSFDIRHSIFMIRYSLFKTHIKSLISNPTSKFLFRSDWTLAARRRSYEISWNWGSMSLTWHQFARGSGFRPRKKSLYSHIAWSRLEAAPTSKIALIRIIEFYLGIVPRDLLRWVVADFFIIDPPNGEPKIFNYSGYPVISLMRSYSGFKRLYIFL